MKEKEKIPISTLEDLHTNSAGYDVLRYISLPDLLGTEKDTILYFMGRSLARNFAINTLGDVIYFFDQVGWGKLELIKEKRNNLVFYLVADSVFQRLETTIEVDFLLEAGFLAEAIHILKDTSCECFIKTHKRIGQVELKVVYTG